MVTIDMVLGKLSQISIAELIENTMVETRQQYITLQREQMLAGKRNDGGMIGRYASPAYAAKKNNPVARAGNVDLYDTGDFQRSIFIDPRGETFVVDSVDNKSEMLQKKYGESIFGLNDEHTDKYVPIAETELHKQVVNALS